MGNDDLVAGMYHIGGRLDLWVKVLQCLKGHVIFSSDFQQVIPCHSSIDRVASRLSRLQHRVIDPVLEKIVCAAQENIYPPAIRCGSRCNGWRVLECENI